MDFIRLPESTEAPTFWDRIANAYYAFNMKTKPDIQAVLDKISAIQAEAEAEAEEKQLTLEEKISAALITFQGYEIAAVNSIAGGTDNWRMLFEHVMVFVDHLPVEDQITVMNYMFRHNRHVVTVQRFRQWMAAHAEAILDNQKD